MIDFQTTLTEVDGTTPVKDSHNDTPMTIGRLCAAALNSMPTDGKNGQRRIEAGFLAQKLYAAGKAEISAKQITMIRDAISVGPYPTSWIAQVIAIIDPGGTD